MWSCSFLHSLLHENKKLKLPTLKLLSPKFTALCEFEPNYDYLYSEITEATLDIKLKPGLSWNEFQALMTRNHLRFGFESIIKKLFEAYEGGLITRIHLQGIFSLARK